jgi:hypothetical protein
MHTRFHSRLFEICQIAVGGQYGTCQPISLLLDLIRATVSTYCAMMLVPETHVHFGSLDVKTQVEISASGGAKGRLIGRG